MSRSRWAATIAIVAVLAGGCSAGSKPATSTTPGTPTTARASSRPTPTSPPRQAASATSAPATPTPTTRHSPIPLTSPGHPGLVVGHRGNAAGAPEDTLVSEVSAEKVGAQVLEFDLHMTADNVPVVMHDDTVNRTTNGTGAIGSLTLAQIEKLDAGSSFSPAFKGVHVPTFAQILAFASKTDAIVLPEFKQPSWTEQQVRIVVDLVRKYHMTARTMFQSFYVGNLQMAFRLAPQIARAGLVTKAPAHPVAFVREFHGQGLLPDYTAATSKLIATLHRARLSIMVWTVDNPAEWAKLTAMGVDGIMTNNPAELRGWYARYVEHP